MNPKDINITPLIQDTGSHPLQTSLAVLQALQEANLTIVPAQPSDDMINAALSLCPDANRQALAELYETMIGAA